MKYRADVENEKRNKSPRYDLLRKRKCVGIIQAARSTRWHVRVIYTQPADRAVSMCPGAGRFGQW